MNIIPFLILIVLMTTSCTTNKTKWVNVQPRLGLELPEDDVRKELAEKLSPKAKKFAANCIRATSSADRIEEETKEVTDIEIDTTLAKVWGVVGAAGLVIWGWLGKIFGWMGGLMG